MAEIASLVSDGGDAAVPIYVVGTERLEEALAGLNERERRFAEAQGFDAAAGTLALLPDGEGNLACVLFGQGGPDAAERSPLILGKLASALPKGIYRLAGGLDQPELGALAFALSG